MCLAFNGRMKKIIRNYKFVYKKLIITSALFRFTGDMVVTGPSGLYHCETSAGQEYEQKKETVDS